MREALAYLTVRGRAFAAAGATATVCAVLMDEPELLRAGLLVGLLPLVTSFVVGRSRHRLHVERSLAVHQVTVGQPARVRLELSNRGAIPTGMLRLEEEVPYVLGTRPRFVVSRMGRRWARTVEYVVRSDLRGRYRLGPLRVRLNDPFGLVEIERSYPGVASLTVVPRTIPLPATPLTGTWTGSGDNRPLAFATGSAEDVTVREYRDGDDLRRVHWRSSARTGELMVRREEQPWQSRATLFLDNRATAHRGSGAASSLEHAVTLTASVAVHLAERGFRVRLVTAAGEDRAIAWHEHGVTTAETSPLLASLAVVELLHRAHVDTGWVHDVSHSGLLVAVLGAVSEQDQPALGRLRHGSAAALAVALDVDAWDGSRVASPGAARTTVGWLNACGWKAVSAGPRDPLPQVWQQLGVAAGRHMRGRERTTSGSGGTR